MPLRQKTGMLQSRYSRECGDSSIILLLSCSRDDRQVDNSSFFFRRMPNCKKQHQEVGWGIKIKNDCHKRCWRHPVLGDDCLEKQKEIKNSQWSPPSDRSWSSAHKNMTLKRGAESAKFLQASRWSKSIILYEKCNFEQREKTVIFLFDSFTTRISSRSTSLRK